MGATAERQPHELAPAWPARPPLAVVRDGASEMSPTAAKVASHRTATLEVAAREAQVWRAAMLGAASGFALVAVVLTIIGAASGLEFGSAVGLGVFVGLFSGGGFGFMEAAVFALARQESSHRSANHEDRSAP